MEKKKYKWQLNMWKDGQFTNSQGINYKLTYSKPLLQYQIDKKFNSHNSKYWWKGKPLKLHIFFCRIVFGHCHFEE